MPILEPLILLFQTSGDISSGFQSQSRKPYSQFGGGVCGICSVRFTCGATPLPVHMASIVAGYFPHIHVHVSFCLSVKKMEVFFSFSYQFPLQIYACS